MSCKICGSSACASWMHSLEDQKKYDESEQMPSDVDELRQLLQEARAEIEELKKEIELLNHPQT